MANSARATSLGVGAGRRWRPGARVRRRSVRKGRWMRRQPGPVDRDDWDDEGMRRSCGARRHAPSVGATTGSSTAPMTAQPSAWRTSRALKVRAPRAFAHADEIHTDGASRDGRQHAALGGAVELGDDQPGQRRRASSKARLRQRVLAGAAVDDQQHLVRRARSALPITRLILRSSSIRCSWVGQAAGGVDQHHVLAAGAAGDDGRS